MQALLHFKGGQAEVDPCLVDGRRLVLVAVAEVRRQAADRALHAVFRSQDAVLQGADIDAAEAVDLDKAVVVDIGDDKADAVEVGVEQDGARGVLAAEHGKEVAAAVAFKRRPGRERGADDIRYGRFASGSAMRPA